MIVLTPPFSFKWPSRMIPLTAIDLWTAISRLYVISYPRYLPTLVAKFARRIDTRAFPSSLSRSSGRGFNKETLRRWRYAGQPAVTSRRFRRDARRLIATIYLPGGFAISFRKRHVYGPLIEPSPRLGTAINSWANSCN